MNTIFRIVILACWFLSGVAVSSAHEDQAEIPTQASSRLTSGHTFGNNPSATTTQDGMTWVTWVRHYADRGDEVVVASAAGGKPIVLTPKLGQYLRPVIAARGNDLWCVWTTTRHNEVSKILIARRTDGKWSPAERLLPTEKRAHQNPEIAISTTGIVGIVYQVHTGHEYDIELFSNMSKEPLPVSESGSNDWDPTIAFDASGKPHVAWSAFHDGDYDIYWKHGNGPAERISARGEYDLHPSMTPSPDGSVWLTWDVVRVPGHAVSGKTTITGANPGHKLTSSYTGGAESWIEVRALEGDKILVPGKPREEIKPPQGYKAGHSGLPKVAIGPNGEPWVVYRALHNQKQKGSWLARGGTLYFWDLVARPLRDGKWSDAVRLSGSDGYLEEASVTRSPKGIHVAFGGEQRIGSPGRLRQPPPKPDPTNHHHDFDGRVGCNGEVFLARLGDPKAKGPAVVDLAIAAAPVDRPVRSRKRMKTYSTTVGGETYQLYWGDTHRHSNVSRCSVGIEPTPDDLYRYGDDICNYDFFALSEHGEHLQNTTADGSHYYWWLNLKLADLYHVPGHMSVLYNYEWTMGFPNGHRNVIFPSRPTLRMDMTMAEAKDLTAGWKTLDKSGLRAITIPHTSADPAQGTDWEAHNEKYQRVVEIFQSCRGSYEHDGCPRQWHNSGNKKGFYWKGLEKGHHMGVIASSDHGYGVAYACVYAQNNSRRAIWQALYDRRCYGSTTYGLVLDFHSGDHWMGEQWSSKEAPLLNVFVRGAKPIRSIEIIGRSKVLHSIGSAESL